MPKFAHYQMSEADDDALEQACAANEIGGLCVAISLAWLERVYGEQEALKAFSQENLNQLVQQQLAYREMALQVSTDPSSRRDAGFTQYCQTRGFAVTRSRWGRIYDSGELDNFAVDEETSQPVKLDRNTGYMLSFSENDIGSQSAHVIALYQTENTIEIRDQNIGQFAVPDMAGLNQRYYQVMKDHWTVLNQQRAEVRRGGRESVSLPQYRTWSLYKLTRS